MIIFDQRDDASRPSLLFAESINRNRAGEKERKRETEKRKSRRE